MSNTEKQSSTLMKQLTKQPVDLIKSKWNPPIRDIIIPPKKYLVFVDFDDTFTRNREFISTHILDTTLCEPIKIVVNAICGYHTAGARIIILTGRPTNLSDVIKTWIESILKFTVEIYCNHFDSNGPKQKSVLNHKKDVCTAILAELKDTTIDTIVHFDDDISVLHNCAMIVHTNGFKYIGHHIVNGEINNIITKPKQSLIVSFLGFDSEETHNILTNLYELLLQKKLSISFISIVSARIEWRTKSKHMSPKDEYEWLNDKIKKACESKITIIIVDTLNYKGSHLKNISSSSDVTLVGTLVPIEKLDKGRKTSYHIPSYYINSLLAKGLTEKTINEYSPSLTTLLTTQQTGHNTIDIVSLVNPINPTETLSINEYANKMCDLVTAKVEELRIQYIQQGSVSAYLGIPVGDEKLPQNTVFQQHITFAPSTTELDTFIKFIGRQVTYYLSDKIYTDDGMENRYARIKDNKTLFCVTLSVKDGNTVKDSLKDHTMNMTSLVYFPSEIGVLILM
jgi:hypothetical protein